MRRLSCDARLWLFGLSFGLFSALLWENAMTAPS
jgi:hypothetical protein